MAQILRFRRSSDRRALLVAVVALLAACLFFLLCQGLDQAFGARAAGVAISPVHEPRVCAAAAVYLQATADDWSQRAAIAKAALNSFHSARAPDCAAQVQHLVSHEFSPIRWQNALNAVDAVASGSYDLPLACVRADTVVPSSTYQPGIPLSGAATRTQCVINGLAFLESAP